MGKLIFILGGARSGKSDFALDLAKKSGKKVAFIATAEGIDKDMKKRIKKHKQGRPKTWQTIEVKDNLDKAIERVKDKVILIDCLTVYTAYFMAWPEKKFLQHIKSIIKAIGKHNLDVIVVSNEVGQGVHPETKAGRDYRDILGRVNQLFAKAADEFYVMFSGAPIDIKSLNNHKF